MFESLYSIVPPSAMANPPARPKILVVDDAKWIRELLKLHLSNAGYDVVTAEDAIIAGKLVLHNSPDLIITDVVLPYMSGTEFVAALRADPKFADIPVIFLTARDDIDVEARRLRAVAHFTKPVSADRLLQAVALHVPTRRAPPAREVLAIDEKKRLRVVVIEDNLDSADSLRRLLEMCGYQVTVANTGREGIRAVIDTHPDVLLCDIGLPDTDGFALARALQEDPRTSHVKMIAVTGYGSDEDRRRSSEVGFQLHLVKPVDPIFLLRTLEVRVEH